MAAAKDLVRKPVMATVRLTIPAGAARPGPPVGAILDQTFDYVIKSPTVSWFLKQAAGVESASGRPGHVVASSVTLKHVYEIATIKKEDPGSQHLPLDSICKSIMGTARSMGIRVVKELD
ncbi:39S ribosomal protein L11 mitochondrial [Bienertia sinuspersici]